MVAGLRTRVICTIRSSAVEASRMFAASFGPACACSSGVSVSLLAKMSFPLIANCFMTSTDVNVLRKSATAAFCASLKCALAVHGVFASVTTRDGSEVVKRGAGAATACEGSFICPSRIPMSHGPSAITAVLPATKSCTLTAHLPPTASAAAYWNSFCSMDAAFTIAGELRDPEKTPVPPASPAK